jgi:hypothetical protein
MHRIEAGDEIDDGKAVPGDVLAGGLGHQLAGVLVPDFPRASLQDRRDRIGLREQIAGHLLLIPARIA